MNTESLTILIQLIGNIAIIIGIIVAIVQVMQMKKQRKELAAIEFINTWQTPEFAKAVNKLQYLPDSVSTKQIRNKSKEMENHAFFVAGFFESTGVLVYRKIIPLAVVDDLIGGVIQVIWKKLEPWIMEWREERNPKFAEWFEWLKNEISKRDKQI